MNQDSEMEGRTLLGEEDIQIGELPIPIHLRIYRRKKDGHLLLEQSHFLKTAIQYLPYAVNELPGSSPEDAVNNLREKLVGLYEQAIRRGYPPSPAWLVPNTSFTPAGK